MHDATPKGTDSRLDALIADFLERQDLGQDPDPEQIIHEHPELAVAFREFLTENERVRRLARMSLPGGPAGIAMPGFRCGDVISRRFQLVKPLGEGGMGTVWLARQTEPVQRLVAIKLIRPGMNSEQIIARFEAERQALAIMDHAHIAGIFDGGITDRGCPFFVMEYIDGVPITEYCDTARLSLRDRLELFIPVCLAVQHAHVRGILHRDLKPSNILVCLCDGKPTPKIIDFGLAKATDRSLTGLTLNTSAGFLLGTPVYMSPEQAELKNADIDIRTDVYSLGVVLYELLTGLTPIDRQKLQQAAIDEILRLIREEEPPRPSSRQSAIGRLTAELDWILLKALEKDRTRRYESSSNLARDLQRYLACEPVEAAPPRLLYRLKKLIRRRRRAAIAAAIITTALISGFAGLVWGWRQSLKATEQISNSLAQVRLEQAEKERALLLEQEHRKAAEQHLFEGIISGIDRDIRISNDTATPPSPISSDQVTLATWSQIRDDRQRIRVLETGLATAEQSLLLAQQAEAVLHVATGPSPDQRKRVITLLTARQRCSDCAPECRAVSCLLTLILGSTDVPALAEAVTVFQPGTLVREKLELHLWQRLADFSEQDRRKYLDLLLSSKTSKVTPPVTTADWLVSNYPAAFHRSLPAHVQSDWNQAIQIAIQDPEFQSPAFLLQLVTALPEESLAAAMADMVRVLRGSLAESHQRTVLDGPSPTWMLKLLHRLPPIQLSAVSRQLSDLLSTHFRPEALSQLQPLLLHVFPRLALEDRQYARRLLISLIRPASAFADSARSDFAAVLRETISEADPDIDSIFAELKPGDDLPEKATQTEIVAPAVARIAHRLSAAQIGEWWPPMFDVALLKSRQPDVAPGLLASGVLPVLEVLAPHIDSSLAADTASRLTSLQQQADQPLSAMPTLQATLQAVMPCLNAEQQVLIRRTLLSRQNLYRSLLKQNRKALLESQGNLLLRLAQAADPQHDVLFLQDILSVLKHPEMFPPAARLSASSLKLLLPRMGEPQVMQAWKILVSAIENRLNSRMSPVPVDGGLNALRTEDLFTDEEDIVQSVSVILNEITAYLADESVPYAWQELLTILRIQLRKYSTETRVGLTLQLRPYCHLLVPTLQSLAQRIPVQQRPQELQNLIEIVSARPGHDLGNSGYHFLSDWINADFQGIIQRLAVDVSSAQALELADWLTHQAPGYDPLWLGTAWQRIIPSLEPQHAAHYWDQLYQQSLGSELCHVGPRPFGLLFALMTSSQQQARWKLITHQLAENTDEETFSRLCEIMLSAAENVPATDRESVVDSVMANLRKNYWTEKPFHLSTTRHVQELAELLAPAPRRRMAQQCIEILLNEKCGYNSGLQNVCNDPRQCATFLFHPNATGPASESLLVRFEKLALHDGKGVLRETHSWANQPRVQRRFLTMLDASSWIHQNWPDFDPNSAME